MEVPLNLMSVVNAMVPVLLRENVIVPEKNSIVLILVVENLA